MPDNKNTVVKKDDWTDWRWQQRNAIRNERDLSGALGCLDEETLRAIKTNLEYQKIQVTPYYISLIRSFQADDDLLVNPLFRQVVPFWKEEPLGGFDGTSENWELSHEMKTPICQHKYDNRVILRLTNTCNSYCQFCFEALRTLKKNPEKQNSNHSIFEKSLEYIRNTPAVEEVILSGGDPLMLTDSKLDEALGALRGISDKLLIRLHSRSLTFNPFRVTDSLIEIFERHGLNSFGVHLCHPAEITEDFSKAIKALQKSVPLIFSNTPLLKGVNDDEHTLRTLFMDLYRLGVKPYYLYHFMPFSPGSGVYKTTISDAISIMNRLKRRVSNIALPEYVLPHADGKYTVPLEDENQRPPRHEVRNNQTYYVFNNWKGDVCEWLDN